MLFRDKRASADRRVYAIRFRYLAATALLLGVAFLLVTIQRQSKNISGPAPISPSKGSPNIDFLKNSGLANISSSVNHARCELVVIHHDGDPSLVVPLDGTLPSLTLRNLETRTSAWPTTPTTAVYSVPVPSPNPRRDASHLVFGVATTLSRLEESLSSFAYWAAATGTRIYAIIEPDANQDKTRVERKARTLELNLQIFEFAGDLNERYFRLIRVLYDNRQSARWASLIDDDTFFPSLPRLLKRLDTHDDNYPLMIGGLSEDLVQMNLWGFMAYGGAGIFLSIPLLAELNKNFDACNAVKWTGDKRVAACTYQHTFTKLSWEPDLHQVDIHGDQSGFYEAARPQPLSVHHWKSWSHFDMARVATVAEVCGDACLLQNYRFSDGWVLVNGISIVKYSQDLSLDDITMEKTWYDYSTATDDSYAHTLAPLRPKDSGKVQLKMEAAVKGNGQVTQYYVHRSESGIGDQIVEIVWYRGF